MLCTIRTSLTVLLLALALTGCASTDRHSLETELCSDSKPVARSEQLRTDGAKLYILIRGKHCDAPVLLWLHGGPGGAETPLFRLFNSALEENYVVVYWDQRGSGHSFDPDADPAQLTVAQHLEDLDLVVDSLLTRLGKNRIVLLEHSWGSALGLLFSRRHPEKIAAFVGITQFVSGSESQYAQYAFVKEEARRRNDRKVRDKLASIGEPPYSATKELNIQSLVDHYGGYFHTRPSFITAILEGIIRFYIAPWDIVKFIQANNVSLEAMNDEILSLDLRQLVPSVETPVVFMLGRFDRQLDAQTGQPPTIMIKSLRRENF